MSRKMQIGAVGETTEHITLKSPSTSSSSRAISISLNHLLRIKVTPNFWEKYKQFRMSQEPPSEPPPKRQKLTPIPEPEPREPAPDVVEGPAEAAAAAAAQGPHRPIQGPQPQGPVQELAPTPRPTIMGLDCENKNGILHSDASSESDSSLISEGDIDIPYSMADRPRPTAEAPLPVSNSPNSSQSIPSSSEKPPVRIKTSSTPAPETKPSVMVTVAGCGPGHFPVMQVIPNSQLAASLREVPCTRPIVWRNGTPRELRNQWTRDASIYFSRGELAAEPCTSCVRGRGPFEQCVRPPNPTGQPPLRGACASCIWTGNPRTCSFHPDHLLPSSSNLTPSKLVGKKPSIVPRTPRTPNTPSSSAKPPSSAKAPPSITKPPQPVPFDHNYNNISNINNNNNFDHANHNHTNNSNNSNTGTYNNGMPPKNVLPVSPAQTIPPSVAPSPTNPLVSSSLPPPPPQRTNPFPNHCYFSIPEKLNGGNLTEVRKAIQEMDAVQAKLKERAAFLEQLGDNWQ